MVSSVVSNPKRTVPARRFGRSQGEVVGALIFLAPGVALLLLAYVYPLINSLLLSFSTWRIRVPGSDPFLAGFGAYKDVLWSGDFWSAAMRSAIFTAVSLPVELVLGTLLAFILTAEFINRRILGLSRVAVLIPLMLPPVVAGILWRLLFDVQYGPLNSILSALGLPTQAWISSPNMAMVAVIVVEVFTNTSVVAMILIGGILSLPLEPILAAKIDGASTLRILVKIKLPQLAPYYLIAALIRSMDLLKAFDFIYAMTFGGPGDSTQMLNLYIFRLGRRFLEYPQAAAASWIFIFLLLPLVALLLAKVSPQSRGYIND